MVFGSWKVQTNIFSLLPSASNNVDVTKAQQVLFSKAEKKIFIALTGDKVQVAYQVLLEKINTIEQVSITEQTLPSLSEISHFYSPYKDNLLTNSYKAALADPQAIKAKLLSQLTQLSNPFVSETIASSPRLNLADYLYEHFNRLSTLENDHGILTFNLENKRFYLMTGQLSIDSFSIQESQLTATKLVEYFNEITSQFNVEVLYSGALFHTAISSQQAQWEISTFGVLSLIAVVMLILVVFRSIRPVFFALMVLLVAAVYGFTAIVVIFQELHLLTLVFAVTLVGIVIDYCFHAFVTIDKEKKLINIIKPLLLGFMTTALGYTALLFSPLALLSQVAVFIVFGLLGALLFVLFMLPRFSSVIKVTVTDRSWQWSYYLIVFFKKIHLNRQKVFIALSVVFLFRLFSNSLWFDDDVSLLNASPASLIANEVAMAKGLGYGSSQRIIVRAKNIEALLVKQEAVIETLKRKQDNLQVKSIVGLLPSVKKQHENYQSLFNSQQKGYFTLALNTIGLVDLITDFSPLTYEDFVLGPLGHLAHLYIAKSENEYVAWLEVLAINEGVSPLNTQNILWLSQQTNVDLYDRAADISLTLKSYRQAVMYLLFIAFALVLLVLIVRYGFASGVLGALPIFFSAFIALSLSQYLIGSLNIFNLLAVLLVLALGIDYVIFYLEKGLEKVTLLAILLSATSSALVFGILAFSITPAVHSFGLTVMIGITFIFLLAPLSCKMDI